MAFLRKLDDIFLGTAFRLVLARLKPAENCQPKKRTRSKVWIRVFFVDKSFRRRMINPDNFAARGAGTVIDLNDRGLLLVQPITVDVESVCGFVAGDRRNKSV